MELMTKEETANYLRRSPKAVDNLARQGLIRKYKLLGAPLFDRIDIDRALKAAAHG